MISTEDFDVGRSEAVVIRPEWEGERKLANLLHLDSLGVGLVLMCCGNSAGMLKPLCLLPSLKGVPQIMTSLHNNISNEVNSVVPW